MVRSVAKTDWILLTFASLTALALASSAQRPLRDQGGSPSVPRLNVGDAAVNAGVFRPFRSVWRELESKADGQREVGTYLEELTLSEFEGHAVLLDKQSHLSGPTPGTFTIILDRKTLAPVRVHSTDARDGSFVQFDFRSSQVEVECKGSKCPRVLTAPAGETVRKSIKVDTPVFDFFGASYGTLLAAMPLRKDSSFEIPVFHPAHGTLWLRVDVHAQEEIECEGKRVKAWKVITPQTGFIMHVADKPPYWLRFESSRPDGAKQIYDRIAAPGQR